MLVSESDYTLELQSEYTLCLNPSRRCARIRVHHTFDWIRVQIVLESEFVLDIHHYSLLYTPFWPSKPSACVRVNHTSERENLFLPFYPYPLQKKCVVSCSLEAFWFCYSVLKSPEKNIQQKGKNEKKEAKKARGNIEGVCVCFLFFCAVVLCDYLGVQARVFGTI
jgi:hypothetical protein